MNFYNLLLYLTSMEKEILYIHGYGSSGSTGRTLEKLLNGYCKVHHFSIPVNPDDAFIKINKYLGNHPEISLIVGSSLGGFIASRFNGYLKLLINPCMHPSIELPKLGCDTEISDIYYKYEDYDFLDLEEKLSTYLMFGTKDELFSYKSECEKYYIKKNISSMEDITHHLNEKELNEFVVPMIKNILEVESPILNEHFEHSF